jgi:hypothetical protein
MSVGFFAGAVENEDVEVVDGRGGKARNWDPELADKGQRGAAPGLPRGVIYGDLRWLALVYAGLR